MNELALNLIKNKLKDTINIRTLFEQIANNNPKAFQIFFDYSYTMLYRYTCYFISNPEACKEVVSDVYYYLWQNRKKLVDIQNMENFLFICVRNQALHYIRETDRFQKVELETVFSEKLSDHTDPEKKVMEKELINTIELAINSLPQRCRLIFFMVKEEGMKYKDVAKNLNISERTVHAQMCIAIKRIGTIIEEYQLGEEIINTKKK